MKKIIYFFLSLALLIYMYGCTGYKPIFSSTKLQFEITDYSIEGNKKLGKKIYYKLYNLSQSKKTPEARSTHVTIKVLKNKNATIKDSGGKILEYRIILNTTIIIKDFLANDEILNQNFVYSMTYKAQDQHYETIRSENKIVENLINKIFEDLLIKMP